MVVEQIEVIEHRIIEEGRRPSGGALLPPLSTVRETREVFESRNGDPLLERRFEVTGERDVSREASFLHTSANYGQQIEMSPQRYSVSAANASAANLSRVSGGNISTGSRVEFADDTVINNFGYDVHEVQTSRGGARIVETHGGGPLREVSRTELHEESFTSRPTPVTSAVRNGLRGANQQVFTVPSPHAWNVASDSESLARKDSYRAMQSSFDGEGKNAFAVHPYPQQSQTSLVSRKAEQKVGCWQRTKTFFSDVLYAFRTSEWTPELLANLCCILLFLILLVILFWVVLYALIHRHVSSEFLLYPPVCEECRRKNPALISSALPSSVFINFQTRNQATLELSANAPFRSNSFTVIDFQTGYVAVVDHALTDANGQHTTCFLLPLDRTAIDSIEALSEAVHDSSYEIQSTFGWQEFWQFDPEPIDSVTANAKFTERVRDCSNARWYLLRQNVHARDASCSDCYDFCLPDYAVVRKEKYDDHSTLGVRRLNCFRLYVPEWKNFRVESDAHGGHWNYPLTSQSTKRNEYGEWAHWSPTGKETAVVRKR